MKQTSFRYWLPFFVTVLLVAGVVVADRVDQGAPGFQGNWKVTANAAIPTGYDWVYATTIDFTNCAAGGSASQALSAGTHMMVVLDEEVQLCHAATCAAGGRRIPVGTIMTIQVDSSTTMSCRSAGATGDIQFTKLQ